MNRGGGRFNGAQTTFPKLLQAAGYQTALFGKWHLGSNPTGFDDWEILPGQGLYYNPQLRTADGKKRYEGHSTRTIADLALDWLRERDASKPFMLMCQFKAPHRTWAPAPRYLTMYDDRDIPEPPTLFDDYRGRSRTLKQNQMSIANHFFYHYDLKVFDPVPFARPGEKRLKSPEYPRMTPEQRKAWDAAYGPKNKAFLENPPQGRDLVRWKYQRYVKDYLRCVAGVDDQVGRLLDFVDEADIADNTIVVYSSDQGFYLGEHGWYDKRWMFEESFKMPLLVRWPGVIKPQSRYTQLVQNIDYAPTFLEAAGVAVPEEMQGQSLVPLWRNAQPEWRKALYYHYYEGGGHGVPVHEGVRTERYKLINFYAADGFNLFDLQEDPMEMKDLSRDPAYKDVLARMQGELQRLRAFYELPPLASKATRKKAGKSKKGSLPRDKRGR
jgi:N-acetylglucosamine-6-sulfatase